MLTAWRVSSDLAGRWRRTGDSAGFFPVRESFSCHPPLIPGVRCQELRLVVKPKEVYKMARTLGTGTGTGSGSVQELAVKVAENPELAGLIKKDPVKALQSLATPLQTDVLLYRIVVGSLGAAVLITLIGAILLVALGKQVPEVLVALGSAAVGALAGLLAPSPVRG
jgi:hypothetical protein